MHRRIAFKILMLIRNCLAGQPPVYLKELCVPVSSLPSRRSLRSAEQGDLVVPRVRLATAQRRSFAVVGPYFWNALPSRLRSELRVTIFLQAHSGTVVSPENRSWGQPLWVSVGSNGEFATS